jgi:ring-1,2-phenylacetyl-CoA epoxidase subunit PaaB
MSDTQWPRFQVFQQEKADEPHQNAGTVHAPDAEMALLNARDVFVRRPECFNLWVVPVTAIFSKTAEELTNQPAWLAEAKQLEQHPPQPYCVFRKTNHKGTHTYAGEVEACSPAQALQKAVETFADRKVIVWWVFPARFITQSGVEDIESMFEPARTKDFRNQSEYHTVAEMRKIKQGESR